MSTLVYSELVECRKRNRGQGGLGRIFANVSPDISVGEDFLDTSKVLTPIPCDLIE